jgi:transposase
VIYRKRLSNDLPTILEELAPYHTEMKGLVVESTYNWYWLVDGLMEADYRIHLANPAAMQQYRRHRRQTAAARRYRPKFLRFSRKAKEENGENRPQQ